MNVIFSKSFRKALARLRPREVSSVEEAVTLYKNNRTDPSLHDHALKGKMKSLRAFSAGHDLRVIYREEGGFITIILLDAGTHNQVY
jgi:addiction module RelE/StbE family toxin